MSKIKSLTDIPSVSKYLRRIGAEERSMRTAVVRENHGRYWQDIAVIQLSKEGLIKAPPAFAPTEQEAALIMSECSAVQWPELKKLHHLIDLPEELKGLKEDELYKFKDEAGLIVMLQQRIDNSEGGKAYVPWTYWSDDTWRRMEPDGKLPLYGTEQLKDNTTVFIHEGAKAARTMQLMVKADTKDQKDKLAAHPWGEEMSNAAHIGWIGGALSPSRTDWSVLKRMGVKRAYIVSDNDEPGLAAVPAIAYHLRFPTFHLQFTNEWPASFDLADEFPKKMFEVIDGAVYYIGPAFRSCIHPATWATDQIPNPEGKGRPITVLRDDFKSMWAYVEEVDMFVCIEMPEILRKEPIMNKLLAGFSHVNNTSSLMVKHYRGRKSKLCYRPDSKGRIVTDRTTSAINLHIPTLVKSTAGDPKPWLEYLEYMFPIAKERAEVMRWCATLIAKPEIRMEYGLLLVSEAQGIGKTTLGAEILAPLVGDQNTGFPTEREIVDSQFNSWVANKRLIIVNEIYSGHSWKAYNRLKGYITDRDIEVNQKFMPPYRIENWAHFFACSNSLRALKIEQDDRRWFYPKITEHRWPREKFAYLYAWLRSGGLGIIKSWAENFGDYVAVGERAPMTEMKKDLIADSRSEAIKVAIERAEVMVDSNEPMAISSHFLREWLANETKQRVYDGSIELHKIMANIGLIMHDRISIRGRKSIVLMNNAAVLKMGAADIPESEYLRELCIKTERDIPKM